MTNPDKARIKAAAKAEANERQDKRQRLKRFRGATWHDGPEQTTRKFGTKKKKPHKYRRRSG